MLRMRCVSPLEICRASSQIKPCKFLCNSDVEYLHLCCVCR